MPIFVNYRRSDSASITGRIDDHLRGAFGAEDVYRDVDDILPGDDFLSQIEQWLPQCDVCLTIIGQRWVSSRLLEENDPVRMEVETALKFKISVIPVLVEDASLPKQADLPPSLHPLLRRQSVKIDSGKSFHADVQVLIEGIRKRRARQTAKASRIPGPPHDEEGFLTIDGLMQLLQASGKLEKGAEASPPFPLLRSRGQRTWLIVTSGRVFCLLDDARTRRYDRVLQWSRPLAKVLPVHAHISSKGNPVVDLGEKRNWLYSSKLHPEPKALEKALTELLTKTG